MSARSVISYRAVSVLTILSFALPEIAPEWPPAAPGEIRWDCQSMLFWYDRLEQGSTIVAFFTMMALLAQGLRNRQANRFVCATGLIAYCIVIYYRQGEIDLCSYGLARWAHYVSGSAVVCLYLRHLIPARNHRRATAVYTV